MATPTKLEICPGERVCQTILRQVSMESLEYEKREMERVEKVAILPCYVPNTGAFLRIINRRPEKNIRGDVCYVSHQKRLRENARQSYIFDHIYLISELWDDMEWFGKVDTCYEPNAPSDHVGEGGVFHKIDPRPQKSIKDQVCYVSHEERLREKARQADEFMSICDQVIAQGHTIEWLLDTAASFSVTGNAANLQGIHAAPPVNATVANGQTISSHHCGRAFGDVSVSGVRYIPGAPDLISGGHLARLGCHSTTSEQGVIITKGGMVVGHGRLLENNTYTLDFLCDNYLGTVCVACPWPHGHGAQMAATSSN